MMKSLVKPWIDEFTAILREPVPSEDPDDWSIRMEVSRGLKLIYPFIL